VSETRRSEAETKYMLTFHQEYTHLSGDQAEIECNVGGCDIDGCQPRYSGMKSTYRIVLDTTTGGDDMSLTFTQGSGNFDDTIATAGTYSPGPFARTVIPGDVLKIAGTSGLLNIDREYTVNTISSDGNTVTVDEAVITENAYAANKVTVDVHRGFNETFAAMSFTQTVIPAPLKAAGAPVGVNNVEYAVVTDGYTILTNSDVDPMDGIQVGSHIKATSISSATYSATHTDILYRVVGMKIEVEKVAAVDVSESQSGDSTTYDVYQSPGTCTVSQTTRGTSEKYECAGRGICDHDSGTCDCFQGYHGFDCGAISPVV